MTYTFGTQSINHHILTSITQIRSLPVTVQPKNNARARSGARSSCAARTRKEQKEVELHFIRKKFQTQEVQNPICKKLHEVNYKSYRKPQILARQLTVVGLTSNRQIL